MFYTGNKLDLKNERVISSEEGRNYALSNGLMFKETSAKEASNVEGMYVLLW